MSSVYLTEAQDKKWAPILDNPSFPKIKDDYRREVTGALLENTQQSFLTEAAPLTSISSGGINNWEPVLINLIRRTMPTVVAYDICSVQPMNGPVGQIFAMRSQYADDASKANWNEALFDAPRTEYSGKGQGGIGLPGTDQQDDMFTASGNNVVSNSTTYNPGTGIDTYDNTAAATGFGTNTAGNTNAENWGGSGGPAFGQMSFTIDRTTVTAKSRALRADYTTELEQDLKQMRGMSVESELTNILSTEIALEINREILYTVIRAAKVGMQSKADYKGIFDADTDSDGRWSVEKWKGLMFHIEREANKIARETRRGKANFIICTSDVASALAMAQILDYTPALQANLEVDDSGNIFAGTLAGRYKVYIDPYWTGTYDYLTLGYKGTSAYDSGIFYCPYIPLEMYRSINPTTYQPSIGFKTRYGLVSNPFTSISSGANIYYRKFKVLNLI
jgi:hypothetical protein